MRLKLTTLFAAVACVASVSAHAEVRITEAMYKGTSGGLNNANREFFELTNLGDAAVNVSGWRYDDESDGDFTVFGNVGFTSIAAHESVIFTELSASAFRSYWGLDDSVQVFSYGGKSNLNSTDTVRILDGATLIDSLFFDDLVGAGVSLNRPVGAVGAVANVDYLKAAVGDVFGSYRAQGAGTDLGNPGSYVFPVSGPAVPEPATWALMVGGFGLVGLSLRRRRGVAFA